MAHFGKLQLEFEFDKQARLLASKKLVIQDSLRSLRAKLPDKIVIPDTQLPFILVLPFSVASFEQQLETVDLGNPKKAFSFLDTTHLGMYNGQITPDCPYLICTVDDGAGHLEKSPDACRELFKGTNRHGLTVEQGLALVHQHPKLLKHHCIHLAGSKITDPVTKREYVPAFDVYAKRLKMKREEPDDADHRWGSPSYGSLVTQ